jgi:hypothetical protein
MFEGTSTSRHTGGATSSSSTCNLKMVALVFRVLLGLARQRRPACGAEAPTPATRLLESFKGCAQCLVSITWTLESRSFHVTLKPHTNRDLTFVVCATRKRR